MKTIDLLAPLSGTITAIESVPDDVFSEKMLGDGIAIDPEGNLVLSPFAGTVSQLPKSAHAINILSPGGVEILIHIGLDTVLLNGKGFSPKVKEGDVVAAGQPLIEFDRDYIAKNAPSLLTMLVVTSGGITFKETTGTVAAGKTIVLKTAAAEGAGDGDGDGEAQNEPSASGEAVESAVIVIPNPAGIHARPAAVLANAAKRFSSSIRLKKRDREANAKSVVAIMRLETQKGDEVTFAATGPDAAQAIAELTPLLLSGLGEDPSAAPEEAAATGSEPRRVSGDPGDPNVLIGVAASPGLVVGKAFQVRHADIPVTREGHGETAEKGTLLAALEESKRDVEALRRDLLSRSDAQKAAIFAAHLELLEDPELLEAADAAVRAGDSAAYAWKAAYNAQADALANLGNALLSGRANDIRDIGRRVLIKITGAAGAAGAAGAGAAGGPAAIPEQAILIAENLTPSDTAGLDKTKVLGFATTGGGASSHVAILARAASIPAVAAAEERVLSIPDGTLLILDGDKGELHLNPSAEMIAAVQSRQQAASMRRKADFANALNPAATSDSHTIKVAANIGGATEAEEVPGYGGDGVGLLRSEFLFLQRSSAPSVEEQSSVYVAIAKALGPGRDMVVRTLDVGGDKPLAYLPLPAEDNPFLGIRGIRLNLVDGEILAAQIRAVLSAAPFSRLHIMFPMVATLEEFLGARDIVLREKEKAGVEAEVKIGLMVEVPSAALLAGRFAKAADFFSIGTNDLTQYALAVDRANPRLAPMASALHPAVLTLVDMTVRGAHAEGKWVGVCGGVAGEIDAVPVLVGLGVDELSVSVSAIPSVKAEIRRHAFSACRALADDALRAASTADVSRLIAEWRAAGN